MVAIKNWKNSKDYPEPGSTLRMRQWAWEFLRRNRRYQEVYDRIATIPAYTVADPQDGRWELNSKLELEPLPGESFDAYVKRWEVAPRGANDQPAEWFDLEPKPLPGETYRAWCLRIRADSSQSYVRITALPVAAGREFGLRIPPSHESNVNPVVPSYREDNPFRWDWFGFVTEEHHFLHAGIGPDFDHFPWEDPFILDYEARQLEQLCARRDAGERDVPGYLQWHHPRYIEWKPKHPKEIAAIFDLEFPLNKQIRRAKEYLKGAQLRLKKEKKLQKKTARGQRRYFSTYLRILDAVAEGVPDVEITAALHPRRKPSKRMVALSGRELDEFNALIDTLREKRYTAQRLSEIYYRNLAFLDE